MPYKVNVNGFSLKTREFIYQIYSEYGEHSSKYLYQWTHSHKIWQDAIASGSKNISKEKISQFFTDVVDNVKAKFLAILPQQTIEIVQAIKKYEEQYATNSSPIIKIISGTDDFSTLVVGGDLFVDKSLMIKELLDNGSEVILIARPRRWGKSINMSMIKRFFEIEVDGNVLADEQKVNKKFFSGGTLELNARYNEPKKLHSLKIASVAYAMKRQGEFPVIFLSLKDIKGNNYQIIEAKVREKIITVFEDHEYLLNSTYISSLDKNKFEDYLSNNIT
ncbi:AAA family ATPase [Rickettsia endosymbiont of Urophora cardui]|uniref:AAA family ATPase n=1 Tax=Rickettsia endosymbiont of Urophora cardui TaxID=3066265 RepID=UPI00313D2695